MEAWRIYNMLTKWNRFNSLTEAERGQLVTLVTSIIAASKLEQ